MTLPVPGPGSGRSLAEAQLAEPPASAPAFNLRHSKTFPRATGSICSCLTCCFPVIPSPRHTKDPAGAGTPGLPLSEQCLSRHFQRHHLLVGSVIPLPLCSFPASLPASPAPGKGKSSTPMAAAAQPAGGLTVTNLSGTWNVPSVLPRGLLLRTISMGVKRRALGQARPLLHPGAVPRKSQP